MSGQGPGLTNPYPLFRSVLGQSEIQFGFPADILIKFLQGIWPYLLNLYRVIKNHGNRQKVENFHSKPRFIPAILYKTF